MSRRHHLCNALAHPADYYIFVLEWTRPPAGDSMLGHELTCPHGCRGWRRPARLAPSRYWHGTDTGTYKVKTSYIRCSWMCIDCGGITSDAAVVAAYVMKEDVRLKRQLGLLHGVGIVAGLVIGSGIYISPQGVILHAGSVGLSLVLWAFGGVLSMLGALTYAELGVVIPQSGATYAYMRFMFGRFAGFLYIWSYLFFARVGANAIKCLMFGRYVLKPFFPDCPVPDVAVKLVATTVGCKSAY